jgi:hypothetical protein
LAVGATVLTILTAAPAGASGSWLEPNWVRVEAGDRISLSGDVSPGQLGWVEDGPYFAYLSGATYGITIDEGIGGNQTDVPLGELSIDTTAGGARVAVTFSLPDDAPPGEYWVNFCNDPCQKGFGDLIGSILYVGMDPPKDVVRVEPVHKTVTTTTSSAVAVVLEPPVLEKEPSRTTYLALAPHPLRPTGLNATWVAISAGIGALVLGFSIALRQRAEHN